LIWTIWQKSNPTLADQVTAGPGYAIFRGTGVALTKRGQTKSEAKQFVASPTSAEGAARCNFPQMGLDRTGKVMWRLGFICTRPGPARKSLTPPLLALLQRLLLESFALTSTSLAEKTEFLVCSLTSMEASIP
jgi:hypothetical protein